MAAGCLARVVHQHLHQCTSSSTWPTSTTHHQLNQCSSSSIKPRPGAGQLTVFPAVFIGRSAIQWPHYSRYGSSAVRCRAVITPLIRLAASTVLSTVPGTVLGTDQHSAECRPAGRVPSTSPAHAGRTNFPAARLAALGTARSRRRVSGHVS
jgi:hypothetical protein